MKKILALLLAVMMLFTCVSVFAEGEAKWTEEKTQDGWIKITQEGGPVLGYSPDSGVTILTVDGDKIRIAFAAPKKELSLSIKFCMENELLQFP